MKQFWRAAFAVAITGFALVASYDVRPAFAQSTAPRLIYTSCEQGNLTVCGQTTEYLCPVGGGISYTYPYTIGFHWTQTPCYPTNITNKYKDYMSSTPTIVITAPRCTKQPTSGTDDDASSVSDEECTDE